MKHLHYANLVFSVSDALADTIEEAAIEFMNAGRSTVWPIACYRDDRDEVSVQIAFGPGIPFVLSGTWLADDRPDPRYTEDSIAYISAELDGLVRELERDL